MSTITGSRVMSSPTVFAMANLLGTESAPARGPSKKTRDRRSIPRSGKVDEAGECGDRGDSHQQARDRDENPGQPPARVLAHHLAVGGDAADDEDQRHGDEPVDDGGPDEQLDR